jgi:hypothetical protein
MKAQSSHVLLLTVALATTLLLPGKPTRAAIDAGVVGTGTPASCTDAALTAALVGGGTVTFNCGPNPVTLVITEKAISADTVVDGGNLVTLSGNNANRHFFAAPTYKFTLKNIALVKGKATAGGGAIEATSSQLTLENVRVAESSAGDHGGGIVVEIDSVVTIRNSVIEGNTSPRGGGIWVTGSGKLTVVNSQIRNNVGSITGFSLGGGIHAQGAVTLTNVLLDGNHALDGGGLYVDSDASVVVNNSSFTNNKGGYGGGIENSGLLTVTGSTIYSNSVTGSGGGVWNIGGAISMTRSAVVSNTASEGGGINSYGNHVDLRDVNIVNNTATGADSGGGGIWHEAGTFFGTNITISGNRATHATGNGGGIYQDSDDNFFFVNATIANNSAARYGGGIYHIARYGIFVNSTFGNNTADVAGPAIYEDYATGPGRVDVSNSVIFGSANNCGGNIFTSTGHNIVAGTCASIAGATDLVVTDAKMGPLAFNGGEFAMQTFAPLTGSPTINWGDATACTTYAPTDQRGAARVGTCDSGAVEYGALATRVRLPLVIR